MLTVKLMLMSHNGALFYENGCHSNIVNNALLNYDSDIESIDIIP